MYPFIFGSCNCFKLLFHCVSNTLSKPIVNPKVTLPANIGKFLHQDGLNMQEIEIFPSLKINRQRKPEFPVNYGI